MENISVLNVTEKDKKAGGKFLSVESASGKLSCFDDTLFDDLKKAVGNEVEVDIVTKGNYKNIVDLGKVLGSAKQVNTMDDNARLRRITDCVLAANEAFVAEKLTKEEVYTHAKGLFEVVNQIDEESK